MSVYNAFTEAYRLPLSILIPCGLLGLLLCGLGFMLRRVFPVALGLAFGIVLGVFIKIWATYAYGPIAQQVEQIVWQIKYFYKYQDIFLDNFRVGLSLGWVVMPLALGLALALLGLKFHRAVSAFSVSLPTVLLACLYLKTNCAGVNEFMHSNLTAALALALLAAVILFLILLFAYTPLFVMFSAFAGSAMLSVLTARSVRITSFHPVLYMCGALFLAGCAVQGILLYRRNVKVRAKKQTACEESACED